MRDRKGREEVEGRVLRACTLIKGERRIKEIFLACVRRLNKPLEEKMLPSFPVLSLN